MLVLMAISYYIANNVPWKSDESYFKSDYLYTTNDISGKWVTNCQVEAEGVGSGQVITIYRRTLEFTNAGKYKESMAFYNESCETKPSNTATTEEGEYKYGDLSSLSDYSAAYTLTLKKKNNERAALYRFENRGGVKTLILQVQGDYDVIPPSKIDNSAYEYYADGVEPNISVSRFLGDWTSVCDDSKVMQLSITEEQSFIMSFINAPRCKGLDNSSEVYKGIFELGEWITPVMDFRKSPLEIKGMPEDSEEIFPVEGFQGIRFFIRSKDKIPFKDYMYGVIRQEEINGEKVLVMAINAKKFPAGIIRGDNLYILTTLDD